MTLRQKQTQFDLMLSLLVVRAWGLGSPVFIAELFRDRATQALYVKAGKSKTMNSEHLEGLAADLVFLADVEDDGQVNWDADKYLPLGLFWESLGGRWGGRFGDNPATPHIEGWDAGHFEYVGDVVCDPSVAWPALTSAISA